MYVVFYRAWVVLQSCMVLLADDALYSLELSGWMFTRTSRR